MDTPNKAWVRPGMIISALLLSALCAVWLWHSLRDRDDVPRATESAAGPGRVDRANAIPSPNASAEKLPSFVLDVGAAPASVRPIVDVSHPFLERQNLTRSLGKDLKTNELEALYGFLLQRHDEDDTQRGQVLKSDLMDALCDQRQPPAGLKQVLREIYENKNQNEVIRDYTVQHLGMLFEWMNQQSSLPEREVQSQRQEIVDLLWQAAAETQSSIGGTGLMALNRIAQQEDRRLIEQVIATSLTLADRSDVSPLVRISAVQVCAQNRAEAALPILIRIAENETDLSLRLSAIGGLGLIGQKPEWHLLQRIEAENNPQLKTATALAIQRIGKRL